MTIHENFDLKEVTTFRLPARADYYVEYDSIEELCEVLSSDICKGQRFLHIGGGSNLLFTSDFHGVILHSRIRFVEVLARDDSYVWLRVGAGVEWDAFVAYCVDNGFNGVENLSLIPGEVGAAAVQNIGAYGVEVKDVIQRVETIDTKSMQPMTFSVEDCCYKYRDSFFKHEDVAGRYVVTAVVMRLNVIGKYSLDYGPLQQFIGKEDVSARKIRCSVIETRRKKLPDPDELGSAGSFFKNPVVTEDKFRALLSCYPSMPFYEVADGYKIPAGWLIENAGLCGYTIGGAQVYEKQCLVIVNRGEATSSDVVALQHHIMDTVARIYGINLSPEVNVI